MFSCKSKTINKYRVTLIHEQQISYNHSKTQNALKFPHQHYFSPSKRSETQMFTCTCYRRQGGEFIPRKLNYEGSQKIRKRDLSFSPLHLHRIHPSTSHGSSKRRCFARESESIKSLTDVDCNACTTAFSLISVQNLPSSVKPCFTSLLLR